MFASKVPDGVELQRRTARIFPDERQDQAKHSYQVTRADRLGANRADERNLGNSKVLDEGQEQWNRFVLDPTSNLTLRWNRVYLISCLFALFIDPFYYYLPLFESVDGASNSPSCVRMDRRLSITITVLRSLADSFYFLNIVIKFFTAYVAPSKRHLGKGELVTDPKEIRRRYIKSELLIDLAAALPLPQIAFWSVLPKIRSSNYNVKNTTFAFVILIQYIIRMYLIVPLINQINKADGVVAKTAWGGAAYYLLLYMLASHIIGAIYYLLSVGRQITCWNSECLNGENSLNTSCDLTFLNCDFSGTTGRQNWVSNTGVFSNCDASNHNITFKFGIFSNALDGGVPLISFIEKYFYCLWWGLQQLSSCGNPLTTSTFIVENAFAIAIGAVSLLLFAQLIGNMQTYLQSASKRLEEWRLRERDTEEWMGHHQLPDHLQERVRRFVQAKWLATRGVNEETMLQTLPTDIRRDVQRHLCLDLVRRVPLFSEMDNQLLDAICERLVSALCTENSFIAREGDPVNEMLFIIRGKLESCTTDGGRTNFFNSIILRPGEFCGEELLTWALLPKTVVNLPTSTRTVRALTEVEAFALRAEDLKFVANQFRRLHSRKLQHTFRFHSHHWRNWGACFIQAAWRQYQRRKMSGSLSRCESYSRWSDEQVAYKPSHENAGASSSAIIDASVVSMSIIGSVSRRFLISDTNMARLQKPHEPDFSEDHFD